MQIAPHIRLASAMCLIAALAAGTAAAATLPLRKSEAAPALAAAIEVTSEGARTSLTVTLSQPVAAAAQLMERPDRVIIDLPEVTFHLPTETGRRREGLIASFRYGLFAPGRSRVVMDLVQPAVVSKLEVQPHPKDGSALLVVELTRSDRDAFRKAASEARPPPAAAAVAPVEEARDRRPLIVLDPGHGGIDPGAAAGGGMVEKEIVFAFTQKLRKRLEASGQYRVLMTRDRDIFIPLGERVRIAQRQRADLFISVHADSISGGQEVRGFTIYTGSERASDAESARLADRENKADQAAGIEAGDAPDEDVTDILKDLTLRETRAFSHGFATRLVGEMEDVARTTRNPHRQAGFRVLRAHDIPSVLVELGYLSSRKDVDLLVSDEWRDKATAAMVTAVDRFFATRLARQGAAAVSP
jgi:N-acetylmuramoyl-L-alanine amidase